MQLPISAVPPGSSGRVGPNVEAEAVLQVASRLLSEGLARLETGPDAALVALRQSFQLERQFGGTEDGERLCRACAGLCRALAKVSHPSPPSEAVPVILQALDTLEARKRRAGKEQLGASELAAHEFLARELLGLARRLGGAALAQACHNPHQQSAGCNGACPNSAASSPSKGGSGGGTSRGSSTPSTPTLRATPATPVLGATPAPISVHPPPRLDELRAADRAFERLAQMASTGGPLRLGLSGGGEDELVITHQELLFQLALTAQTIGSTLMREQTSRDTEAATFYYSRAVRKLRLAGISDREAHMRALLRLVAEAEAQAEELKNPTLIADREDGAGRGTAAGGGGGEAADDDSYCVVS